jgi:hypothetical protein
VKYGRVTSFYREKYGSKLKYGDIGILENNVVDTPKEVQNDYYNLRYNSSTLKYGKVSNMIYGEEKDNHKENPKEIVSDSYRLPAKPEIVLSITTEKNKDSLYYIDNIKSAEKYSLNNKRKFSYKQYENGFVIFKTHNVIKYGNGAGNRTRTGDPQLGRLTL